MKKNYKIKISPSELAFFLILLIVIGTIYYQFVPQLISLRIHKPTGISYGDFRYLQDGDQATIVGYTGAGGAIVIPETVNGLPVTRIGACAFSQYGLSKYSSTKYPHISSIALPQNLQYIGEFAFESLPITQIQIPSNVIDIGYWAFGGTKLGSVDIPGTVKIIETNAFANCNLKTVTLEDGIETIYCDAFSNDSFYNGHNENTIQALNIPESVTKIEAPIATNPTFSSYIVDSNNKAYSSTDDGLLLNKAGNALICCPSGKTGDLVIPSSVQTSNICTLIDAGVFGGCSQINSILFQSNNTFFDKDSLKNIEFKDCTKNIDDYNSDIKYYNDGINDHFVENNDHFDANNDTEGTDTVTDSQGAVYSKTKDILISCPKDLKGLYVIPSGVTTISDSAFYECRNITSIFIPNTVTTIGSLAFDGCDNLNKINIPTSVTTIGDCAFDMCFYLSDITIPSSVTNIGVKVFGFAIYDTTVHGEAGSKIESYVNHYSLDYEVATVNFTTSPEAVNYWEIALQGAILYVYVILVITAIFLILLRVRTCKEKINTDSEELE